jgi:hypothetical protein
MVYQLKLRQVSAADAHVVFTVVPVGAAAVGTVDCDLQHILRQRKIVNVCPWVA